MAYRIQFRRDLSSNWTANNPILLQGEFGYELDTGFAKIGDGSTNWSSLDYFGGTGPTGPVGSQGSTGATGQGVPTGGATGSFLVKNSSSNYDYIWSSSIISPAAPGSSGAVGASGQAAFDSNYLYICIGTNSWRRIAYDSWP